MRRKTDAKEGEGEMQQEGKREEVDAVALGLVGNKAGNVHLSPVKKRKMVEGEPEGEKRTRFMTKEGIKVAGRESGGGDVWLDAGLEGEDDDELDIV